MKKTILMLLVSCFITTLAMSQAPAKPWPVADKFSAVKNPVKPDATNLKEGRDLYVTHCQSCHGKKGKGDGTKAAQLETECGDFTTAAFLKETDGALYYKITEGRKDMPSFKKKIPEQSDIWNVVNYVRSIK
jgi:mono/diheme cytochrome c family protein